MTTVNLPSHYARFPSGRRWYSCIYIIYMLLSKHLGHNASCLSHASNKKIVHFGWRICHLLNIWWNLKVPKATVNLPRHCAWFPRGRISKPCTRILYTSVEAPGGQCILAYSTPPTSKKRVHFWMEKLKFVENMAKGKYTNDHSQFTTPLHVHVHVYIVSSMQNFKNHAP